ATKTHVLVADQEGWVVGMGESGPGNHETVGYPGLRQALAEAMRQALAEAGLPPERIAGAGFGVGGYDWPSERDATLQVIHSLGLSAPLEVVNDTTLGILAGATDGWGIAVVSGTGCNCRGWDPLRQHEGRVIGRSTAAGEGAGSTELMAEVVKALAYEWTQRGPHTALSPALIHYAGASSLADLLEGYFEGQYELGGSAAPLVFQVAADGDPVAQNIIRWAGCELGEMIKAVIRQMQFEALQFDVVMLGSMFDGGEMLQAPMRQVVWSLAPGAKFLRLSRPPVTGAVLLGMQAAGHNAPVSVRENLLGTTKRFKEASTQ
ncbi:MAG TPA: BadF/BadG/BcrA/BcrD ATPase family protein, partial [Anaerolineaceae bacterium]|nr:BadF/BadG/BcrA/BcrD ATPase family protein [Anaerolineaceae bacterium]